ncbi:MAG: hypothetical protein GY906_28180, partial [bacterium]|nr:hypothetical protein [bacterium]
RAPTTAAGEYGEVPHERVLGGSLSLADALTVARHLVVGDEVRKPDMLASVNVDITTTSHRLAAIPFERAGNQLKCAVTGVSVPAMV